MSSRNTAHRFSWHFVQLLPAIEVCAQEWDKAATQVPLIGTRDAWCEKLVKALELQSP